MPRWLSLTSFFRVMEPTTKRKGRRRSHEASDTSSGQVVQTTGRAEERRRAILDEWFAKTEGKGTAGDFAVEVNAFVSQHAKHADPDLSFTSQAISKYLAIKLQDGNKRVSKKAADAKAKASWTWTIRTPVDLRPNMTTVDRRTLDDLKQCREQLKGILKFQEREELPEVVDGDEFFDAKEVDTDDMDVDGTRRRLLSPEYKLAVRSALYMSGCSQAKFPYVHATLVYFTIKELGYKLDLDDVLSVVPTDLGSIIDFCADMDDYRLYQQAAGVSAPFAISDKGKQNAGTGTNDLTQNLVTGYDYATGAPWGPVHLSAQEIEKGGAAIAQSIVDDGKRVGIFEWFGSCTDSASDCIKGMVKEMSSRFPSFIETACFLHVMNLVLVNSYLASFGDEERGVCSALRIGYCTTFSRTSGCRGAKKMATGASPTLRGARRRLGGGLWWRRLVTATATGWRTLSGASIWRRSLRERRGLVWVTATASSRRQAG